MGLREGGREREEKKRKEEEEKGNKEEATWKIKLRTKTM